MKRFAYFVNFLFSLTLLRNTLFCVHRFARRRTIASRPAACKLYFNNSAIAMPISVVLALPPISGVRGPCSSTCSMAARIASWAAV